ncbi:Penicillin amidase [Lentibacillus halodurans]|uniref:Penicillin amidase n=1 Tax=Lentibacillus halodurans TaxID=237679 RepID=A0A1I1A4J9_9BACI|nr:penicillin acylase family protein [Lentibacillus halodurans]SFB32954.1 Penicillin amidase [Lentibacillus halodurans]
MHTSLERRTLEQLTDEYGSSMADWQWGDYHKVRFDHPLSDTSSLLSFFFKREDPIPPGGSGVTPMAASYKADTGIVDHGVSWRFVLDTDKIGTGYHIVGPGQAGHSRSDWYHNQMNDWEADGVYHVTKMDEPVGMELTLTPQDT